MHPSHYGGMLGENPVYVDDLNENHCRIAWGGLHMACKSQKGGEAGIWLWGVTGPWC